MHGSPSREIFPLTRYIRLAAFLFMRSTPAHRLTTDRNPERDGFAIHDDRPTNDALIMPQKSFRAIEHR